MDELLAQVLTYCIGLSLLGILILYVFCYFVFGKARYYTDGSYMQDKVVLVTGGDSGLGYETALDLAKRWARVIITAEDPQKGTAAVERIIDATGNHNVVFHPMIPSDMRSVKELVSYIQINEKQLHVLVHAAEIVYSSKNPSPGCPDEVFTYNHLGPFLLTYLLLDLLKQSAPSRIIYVLSIIYGTAYAGDPYYDLKVCKAKEFHKYSILKGHKMSRIGSVLQVKALSRKLAGTDVTINAVHPGAVCDHVLSPFKEYLPSCMISVIGFLLKPIVLSYKAGAQTIIYCAVEKSLQHLTGKTFHKCRQRRETRHDSRVADLCDIMWDMSAVLVGLAQPPEPKEEEEEKTEEEFMVEIHEKTKISFPTTDAKPNGTIPNGQMSNGYTTSGYASNGYMSNGYTATGIMKGHPGLELKTH